MPIDPLRYYITHLFFNYFVCIALKIEGLLINIEGLLISIGGLLINIGGLLIDIGMSVNKPILTTYLLVMKCIRYIAHILLLVHCTSVAKLHLR